MDTTERPILFSGPMVRALLAGTKTQTRRVVKGAPDDWAPMQPQVFSPTVIDKRGDEQPGADAYGAGNEDGDSWFRCPYGQPGDRLWVRETFQIDAPRDGTWHDTQWYGCKGSLVSEIPERFQHPRFCNYAADWRHGRIKWRPGIHMPRWASRITLEIIDVRVERLQAISEADAIAEGIEPYPDGLGWRRGKIEGDQNRIDRTAFPRLAYQSIWEAINGPGSWAANPWVWVVEFKLAPS